MSPLRIGINGLGRIGRLVLRRAVSRALAPDGPAVVRTGRTLEIVAVNDIAPIEQLVYLLTYDSAHGTATPRPQLRDGRIEIGPVSVHYSREREPANIPWSDHGVDLVLDCSGRFKKRSTLEPHLDGPNAPRWAVLGAPGEVDRTIVVGVNESDFDPENDRTLSCASCTTNALAPVLGVLDKAFGVRWGLASTVHAYTADQGLVDGMSGKDYRRGRAAATNIVPTSTGASKAVAIVLPRLAGKLAGSAVRVPVVDGSMYEITCTLDDSPDLGRAIEALRDASSTDALRGILDVRDDPIVSSDVIGDSHSSIVDVGASLAQGPLLKIAGWYDNEAGYASRLLDLAAVIGTA